MNSKNAKKSKEGVTTKIKIECYSLKGVGSRNFEGYLGGRSCWASWMMAIKVLAPFIDESYRITCLVILKMHIHFVLLCIYYFN